MDIQKLKEREVGIFSKKIYCGHFFADKVRDDFDSDEEYKDYLDSLRKSEYVIMREPSTPESNTMMARQLPEEVVARMTIEKQEAYYKKLDEANEAKATEMLGLVKKCIVGSSFTDGGNALTPAQVGEMVEKSSTLTAFLIQEWMESSVNFQKMSGRSSAK